MNEARRGFLRGASTLIGTGLALVLAPKMTTNTLLWVPEPPSSSTKVLTNEVIPLAYGENNRHFITALDIVLRAEEKYIWRVPAGCGFHSRPHEITALQLVRDGELLRVRLGFIKV